MDNIALVSIAGEGMARKPGTAARCFSVADARKANIEMIDKIVGSAVNITAF